VRILLFTLFGVFSASAQTAWRAGHFEVDPAGLVSRSDIILSQPNTSPEEAMPMGNGRLGIAVWSADGLTAQLNRVDTLPHRDSPGQIVIPGLSALSTAKDFRGRLDLYNGTLEEHGACLTLKAYVQTSTDTFVVDVTGADREATQTAQLRLWPPRSPQATASGQSGMLAQTWVDDYGPGASSQTFGALAAITASGRDVSASVSDPRTITVTFKPAQDGHFRVIVACPHYSGQRPEVSSALANADPAEHSAWWHSLWGRAGLIKITSADVSGEYMENLRNLYLYTAAAESGSRFPGSQAGIADMFSAVEDTHHWDPAAFWHWNLRMQVAANLAAGLPELNLPYFRLYRENLDNIKDWTRKHLGGRPGICVPETMRFNGQGIEWEPQWNPSHPPAPGLNCDAASKPYYNARTLSTGAEISLWIWRQYLATGDLAFLRNNYPVMQAAAQFLLAYETPGSDGKMHTKPSNAHEQQWDTLDPTTDLAARSSLFPAVIEAAKLLHRDDKLVQQLKEEAARIPQLPQTADPPVIAESYDPTATQHNEENIGLEPVWPYELIGDDSPMLALARATYAARPYPVHQDWSFDPVQAARLGLKDEVQSTLIALTEKYQKYVNGFANWGGPAGEFYVEQEGVVALAVAEALVQDYDGLIRIAPAVPSQWTLEGSVWVRHHTRVDVQVRAGDLATVAIEAGATEVLRIRNPWPGQQVVAVDAKGGNTSLGGDPTLHLPVRKGEAYRLLPASTGSEAQPFASLSGEPTQDPRKLGPVQIGK
jgi:alpha-L-fucosidase 2